MINNPTALLVEVYNHVYTQPASWWLASGMTLHAEINLDNRIYGHSNAAQQRVRLRRLDSKEAGNVIWHVEFENGVLGPRAERQMIYRTDRHGRDQSHHGSVVMKWFSGNRDQYHRDLVLAKMFMEAENEFVA